MKQNPLTQGVISENFKGIGAVTEAMIEARACELSLIVEEGVREARKKDGAES